MSGVEIKLVGGFKMEAKSPIASKTIMIDAPKQMGGEGTDMSPTDLLAASLGSCMITLMQMKAKSLKIDIQGARAEVDKTMVLSPVMKVTAFHIHLHLPAVEEQHRAPLEAAALHCPVHTALDPKIKQDIHFHWA
ncbi:MAG: OsmC family protein [Verrucomicrobia bacterium]|nr:OsmC family protein [Verrucomicrobiota bacterium]